MIKQHLSRLSKNALIYGVGGILSRAIGLLLLPLLTTYLTPAEYGIHAILGVIIFFLTPIFSFGLGPAMGACYFDGNRTEQKEATIWTAGSLMAIGAIVLAVVSIVFPRQISQIAFSSPIYHHLVTISLLTVCLSVLLMPFMLYLQFEERAKTFIVVTIASTLASAGLSVGLVVVFKQGIQGVIQAAFIGQALALILIVPLVVMKIRYRFSLNLGRQLLRLGIPLIPAFFALFIIQHGNKYILQMLSGVDTLGVYSIGLSLGMVLNLFVNGFTNAWLPFAMSFVEKQDEAKSLFGRVLTYYILSFGTFSLLFFIAAKPLVMIFTQPAFHDAYQVVGLSATAQFLTGVYSILLPSVYFAKEVQYLTLVQGCASIISVVINVLLISSIGILGAAIGLALSVLIMNFLQQCWNLSRKHYSLKVEYQWDRLLYFTLVYVGFVIMALWEKDLTLFGELTFSLITTTALISCIYLLLYKGERQTLWTWTKQLLLNRPIWSSI